MAAVKKTDTAIKPTYTLDENKGQTEKDLKKVVHALKPGESVQFISSNHNPLGLADTALLSARVIPGRNASDFLIRGTAQKPIFIREKKVKFKF
jgi:hypothetical protein